MPGKSRACGEQVAHRVFFFPVSRTHAVVSGCAPSPGFCWPGLAPAVARRAPCLLFAVSRTHAVVSGCAPSPGFCWPGLAPAVSKTRTVFVPLLSLARTRLFPGARLLLAGARTCGGQDAHRVCAFGLARPRSGCAPAASVGRGSRLRRANRPRFGLPAPIISERPCQKQENGRIFSNIYSLLLRLWCGGRKRESAARAKRREKRRMRDVRNGGAQGITASGGEILTRTKPNRERMNNR